MAIADLQDFGLGETFTEAVQHFEDGAVNTVTAKFAPQVLSVSDPQIVSNLASQFSASVSGNVPEQNLDTQAPQITSSIDLNNGPK